MTTPSFADVNVSDFPVVHITFERCPKNSAEMAQYLAQFEGVLTTTRQLAADTDTAAVVKFIITLRTGVLGFGTIPYLTQKAQFIKGLQASGDIDVIGGTAIIIESPLCRTLVDFVLRHCTLSRPHRIFESSDDARSWLASLAPNAPSTTVAATLD